jgi:hypothetical protein
MSEYHEDGLTKPERYSMACRQINSDFDKKLNNKSIFTSKSSIQEERQRELKKAHDQIWSTGRSGGGFCD